jgi:predicted dehydrogenase
MKAVPIMSANRPCSTSTQASRRDFIRTSGALVVGGALTGLDVARAAHAASSDMLRIGLVGCGGRGTGAAGDALEADSGAVLTAMGDAFEDQLKRSLNNLRGEFADRVKVEPDRCFVGLDAYQKVIDSGVDVVLLATPPGFRPLHLAAAVAAGKHVFCEKPMATDAPGVRSVFASAAAAREKKLAIVAGFCWRYDYARREVFKQIHDRALGDMRAIYATYYTGPVKPMQPPGKRSASCSDLEWQLRNWYNFVWLSGDGLVEQAVHSVDKIAWTMRDVPPLKAVAVGGRQTPNYEGNIYDHMEVNYEYAGGVRAFMGQRQIVGCYNQNADYITGSAGIATIGVNNRQQVEITGTKPWHYTGAKNNMYKTEHEELFASIRSDNPINDGIWMTQSTLMAIMGRMAAYTGQEITWEQALNSQEKLVPDPLDWNLKLPIAPMAIPGQTKFI